ncbi:NAD(P)H-dependent oxidoreductase [Hanstruepera neustonica]|uniref:NAD(P)H-dependent oxidoreductase n=1 Tax=Hanstruepera neustonica TaxID=1445657 RepID=A0A2K1DXR1_9FLAO|nr:NAD(P)H-dependent oxidoreductase [Hanstruepera neustonica]PNQ72790.1 NAD(P)H-dependent oxidoreductase [Hanstruepera neustonica]
MNVIDHLQWRYATKAFDSSKLISDEKLQVLTEAFNLTATSYGLQPIKLVVFSDKTLQTQLIPDTMNQKQIAEASHVLVFCIETAIDEDYVVEYFNRVHDIRHTPKSILKPFQDFLISDFEKKPQALIEDWATNQAYLAMGNILTVCALEGIDSCPMEGFKSDRYDEVLGLKKRGLKSVLLLPIGYRADDDMFADFKKVRKPLKDSIITL